MIGYFLYSIVKALSFTAKFIPVGFSVFTGRLIGYVSYDIFIKKRQIAYKNLKIAFPSYSCKEINKIIRQSFMNCAQHVVEILYLPWMDEGYIKRHIEFEGLDKIIKTIDNNKRGAIFVGLHEGSWELGNMATAQMLKKYSYTVLTRTQKDIPSLYRLLNQYRVKKGCNVVAITDSFRPLVEHLKKGLILGMVADHGAQGGIFVDFFGRSALTPTGAIKLALKLNTILVIGFMKRVGLTKHRIYYVLHELIRTNDLDEDMKTNLESINRKFEDFIKKDPAEYLWFFKRWKHSDQRNILVLSDGKPGHVKQSLALLDLIKTLPYKIKSDILEIKFQSLWRKIVFLACSFFFSNKCQGCMSCLRGLFDSQQANQLLSSHYDAVISCGSSLPMVNRLIAFENMSKSIVVMKPGMFSLKRFDLAIIPEHDNPPRFKNVSLINGALYREIDNDSIKSIVERYSLDNPPLSKPTIGILLGGESKRLSLNTDIVEGVLNSVDGAMKKLDGSVLISTSRRTTKQVEELVKTKTLDKSRYRMLIIANEDNPKGSFESILSLSDILIVSGDSISMVSEAISAKKYIIITKPKRKRHSIISKHEKFVENLADEQYAYIGDGDLTERIIKIWEQKPPIKELSDQGKIIEKLKEVL